LFKEKNIFQYGHSDFLENVLIENTIGFSSLTDFNDPFESYYSYNHYVKSFEAAFQYLQEMENGPMSDKVLRIRNLIEHRLSSLKVSCFSETPYEPLMWAHYSNKHKGLCYCFNKDEGLFDFRKYKAKQVLYSNLLPQVDYFDDKTSFEMLKPQIESIVHTKSDKWAYEKEYRYYCNSNESVHNFNPKALQAVIMGFRYENKELAEELINRYNEKHKMNVKLLYAKVSPDEYRMNISEKDYKTNPKITLPNYNFNDKPIK
jgi:hypothetical protein